ncbi:MAG: hypothetical protein IE932_01370 [Sphingopyxis terrae]|nr:hypothetical protein [Sphingopyxis terrae]
MTAAHFDPADPGCWSGRGRSPEQAEAIAEAWRIFPDLPHNAPLDERMARTRARVAAMRPVHEAIRIETEQARVRANFAFAEAQVATVSGDPRYSAVLRGRDLHQLGWDAAVAHADGHHAARAGWDARPSSWMHSSAAAAYDLGFRDGGGRPDYLFDAARRALSAPLAGETISGTATPAPRARPLPSDWPAPTDAPRPVRWPRRLMIFGGGALGDALAAEVANYPESHAALTILARAGSGFRAADGSQADWRPGLRDLLVGRDIEDVLVAADGADLDLIDGHAADIPLCRSMERTRNSLLQQRAQFRHWLARGLAEGETRAAGHIRWGKMSKGLYGRLGEFTARYTGPHRPRGHRIIVERAAGIPASGYRAASGRALDPERIISNRSHLRREMTNLLRDFAAALHQP